MQQATQLMITNEHVNLLSVRGRLDRAGLRTLQQRVDRLLDAGARFLLTDLSRAEHFDNQVFELLTRTNNLVKQRGGWLRLIAPGNSVVSTVDEMTLPADLPMDPAPDRADPAIGHA